MRMRYITVIVPTLQIAKLRNALTQGTEKIMQLTLLIGSQLMVILRFKDTALPEILGKWVKKREKAYPNQVPTEKDTSFCI
ncbi:hypothetical protein AV530_009930 [Patagioenas fasciata monilis]|uniref:Uncharacterized protein n=1 Tax=Patagioenas fasciata monilis TaxID=372326 RepID=A0A1V4KAT7_PATFA|nr:hypothetical protein AV530_009930 [Patagioenas fasciata monilis]